MAASDAQRIAIGSARSWTSSSWRRMNWVRIPRRRWVGRTATHVTPAAGTSPPGIVSVNGYDAAAPTGAAPSYAVRKRSGAIVFECRSKSSSSNSSPNPLVPAAIPVRSSSTDAANRISIVIASSLSGDLFERCVVKHQPPLASVGEPYRHDAARLDRRHDSFAERFVAYGIPGGERRRILAWRDFARCSVVGPRCRPQPLAFHGRRKLVEEAGRKVVAPCAPERARRRVRQREQLPRTCHPDVAEPPLFLDPLLLDRARVREDPLLHPDQVYGAELEPLRVVQRHQRHQALLAADRVLVRIQRDLLQEVRERGLVGRLLVLPRDADQLLKVLGPSLRLDRSLGLERLEVPALVEDALDEIREGELERS